MQYHYLRCTGKSPSFKCSECSRKYESKTGLNYHMTSAHGAPPMEEVKVGGSMCLLVQISDFLKSQCAIKLY